MSYLYSLFNDYIAYYLWSNTNTNDITTKPVLSTTIISAPVNPYKFLITSNDLNKVNLKPPSNIIPNPSRNMPLMDRFNLAILNKAQLKLIMSVKLKPTNPLIKQTYYEPRHPVLKELLFKRKQLE
jgi:hypothetical protein